MDEKDRLTVYKKHELSSKHAELNQLLNDKRKVEQRISDLMCEVNRLRNDANKLDQAFHRKVIEVAPTEVVDLKKPREVKTEKTKLQEKLLKFAKKNPQVLQDIIDSVGKGV